jgi:hypothetical protein
MATVAVMRAGAIVLEALKSGSGLLRFARNDGRGALPCHAAGVAD